MSLNAKMFYLMMCTVTSVAICQIARKLSSFPPGDLAVHESQSFLDAAWVNLQIVIVLCSNKKGVF